MTLARDRRAAAVLTLSELIPADPRDLTDLLRKVDIKNFDTKPELLDSRASALLDYLISFPKDNRTDYWAEVCSSLLSDNKIHFTMITDGDYPNELARAYDCPPFLFREGRWPRKSSSAISIVGGRSATSESLQAAHEISAAATEAGFVVVSGLAHGIDTAAHEAALDSGGRTIAVLAGGIDHPLSRSHNFELAGRIVRSGALLSPFRPTTPPTASAYVSRNAVISGLSVASLIVEGAEMSGSTSEGEHAIKQGRLVLLWRPSLGSIQWAERFAMQPLVHWVSSPEEVLSFVRAAA